MATAIATIVRGRAWRAGSGPPRPSGRRHRTPARLSIESLEVRSLLNGSAPTLAAFPPNETADQSWDLGSLDQPATVLGAVGTGPDGGADVTWYHFQLQGASRVALSLEAPAGDRPFAGVLSLFDGDPGDAVDPYDLSGYRLMAQVQSGPQGGAAALSQALGDYYVAVSGAGNTAFSPVIAGSGFRGDMGVYELTADATDLGLAGDGPTVLWSDPAAGADPAGSPLFIRIGLSEPIDATTIVPGQTVQLLAVSDGAATPVGVANVNVSASGDELQIYPAAPMAPGSYVVQLSGDSSRGQPVLADLNGVPLGEDAQDPSGADESYTFQVSGVDGVPGATTSDDTAATARQLGDVAGAGLIQVAGAIGIDPAFNPMNSDPSYDNPANQVDLYHFRIDGPGRYAMLAEVFAGRIGSTLDPGVSLFELDPATGRLDFLAGDNNTYNATAGTDGSIPLLTDAALDAGLTAGDYYLAVADGPNTPSPIEGQDPGAPGILDPNLPGSAQDGWSTGPYLLNLLVEPASAAPTVINSSPAPGQVLNQAPQQITVQFSGAMDLQQLAYATYMQSSQFTIPQVFIEGADGSMYSPRFENYDRDTNTATFQMLDPLPDGSYTLHLSGPGGLTDLAGDPLVGDATGGDEVIPFTVQAPAGPLVGSDAGGFWTISQAGLGVPQDLGVLFPDPIQAGISVVRYPEAATSPGASSPQDSYTFQVLQSQDYGFQLIGDDLPAGVQVSLSGANGQAADLGVGGDQSYFGFLEPGTYTLSVGGWSAGGGADLSYLLLIQFGGQQDNAPPLVDGPAPALQVSFVTAAGSASAGFAPFMMAPEVSAPVAGEAATGPGVAVIAGIGSGTDAAGPAPANAPSTASPLVSLAHAEAASGLAGLGMGPLGGSAAPSAASPTIQVALEATPADSMAAGSFAVGLVTLTQVFPFGREGESFAPADLEGPPVVEEDVPPPPPVEVAVVPRDRATAPEPVRSEMAAEESPRVEPPALPVATAPATVEEPKVLRADVPLPPPPAVEEPELSTGGWATRWAIAAATIAVASRPRVIIRGLKWMRGPRAVLDAGRPVGPVGPRGPHGGRRNGGSRGQVRADGADAPPIASRPAGPVAPPLSRRARRGSLMGFRFDEESLASLDAGTPGPTGPPSFSMTRARKRELLDEQRSRWDEGHPSPPEAFLGRWPADPAVDPDAASLLLEDYLRRRRRGDEGSLSEYEERFPSQRRALEGLLARETVFRSMGGPEDAPAPLRLPEPGDEVFGFRLRRPLGEGAFARVFLAEQADLAGRPVVLKVSDIEGSEPQTLAQLLHTNIVPIYSLHEDARAGLRAVCMPYLGGASLAAVLSRLWADSARPTSGEQLVRALEAVESPRPGAFRAPAPKGDDLDPTADPAAEGSMATLAALRAMSFEHAAAWIAAQLADGLHHAHQRGIFHRDIKPSNILIGAEGQPLLLDFNLAQGGDPDPARATIGGTIAYMAPEHLRALLGRTPALIREVDARSDIYSLGMVLAEMLTGNRPFQQSGSYSALPLQIEAMAVERSRAEASVRRDRPDLSWGLESIARKCLAPDPSRRYRRADHLADDLRRLLDDRPLKYAPELSRVERARKFARRHPRLASSSAVATAAWVILLAVGSALSATRSQLDGARARDRVREHDAGMQKALCLVNTRLDLRDQIRDGIAACERTLALFGPPGDPAWDRLDPDDRRRLAEDRRELLMLLADARARRASGSKEAAAEALRLLNWADAILGLPPSRALWLDRARYLAIAGDVDGSRAAGRRAEAIPATTARDHYQIAGSMARRGDPESLRVAIAELDEALKRNPRHYWSVVERGICHLERGELVEAAGDFGRCTGLWPEFAWGHFNRGCVLDRAGDKAAAIGDYSAALERDPELVPAYVNRGLARLELKRDVEALADFDRAAALGANGPAVSAGRGVAMERMGLHAEADAAFAESLSRSGDLDPTARARLARSIGFAIAARDPARARAAFDEALKHDPRDARARYGLGMLAMARGDDGSALRHLDRALVDDPGHAEARRYRAILLARKGDWDAASREINACLARDPRSSATLYAAACVVARAHGALGARETAAQAIDLLGRAAEAGADLSGADADPDLAAIRRLPRFRRLADRGGGALPKHP